MPLFSLSVLIENIFQKIYPRQLGGPHTNLYSKESLEFIAKKYNFNPSRPLVLFTQHPVTTEYGQGSNQINVTINALKLFPEFEILALYSNPDAGGREIINLMKEQSNFHTFPNIHSDSNSNKNKLQISKIWLQTLT